MTIRTISQLPSILDTLNIDSSALFEVSTPVSVAQTTKYASKKCTYKKIRDQLSREISDQIAADYALKNQASGYKYQLKNTVERVENLEKRNMTIAGRKAFTSIPVITQTNPALFISTGDYTTQQLVPNIGKVIDLVGDHAGFISENYIVDDQPVRNNHSTTESSKFMFWHFDNQSKDSSEWIDPFTNMATGPVYVNNTGWLSITGWLADNGNLLLQDAWVGLFGLINVRNQDDASVTTSQWVPLQYQPWPISSRSSQRQYVSFSLPVKRGLQLKIKTGFNVNGDSGGFQSSASIQLPLNEPNTFVGWVMHS